MGFPLIAGCSIQLSYRTVVWISKWTAKVIFFQEKAGIYVKCLCDVEVIGLDSNQWPSR